MQAQRDAAVEFLRKKSIKKSKFLSAPQHTTQKSMKQVLKALCVYYGFQHAARHHPLRGKLGLLHVKGGVRAEHMLNMTLVCAYVHWLTHSKGATVKAHGRSYNGVHNYCRGVLDWQEYVRSRVQNHINKHPELDVGEKFTKLLARINQVCANTKALAHEAKQAYRLEKTGERQDINVALRGEVSASDAGTTTWAAKFLEVQQRAMDKFVGWDARLEMCGGDVSLTALKHILECLPPGGVPEEPLSRQGRDLAAAVEATLLKALTTGCLVPPTRESVLVQTKWAHPGSKLTCCNSGEECTARGCPGNVIWVDPKGEGDIILDWRHHKTNESKSDKAFCQSISDPRFVSAMHAWCKWAWAVHYHGVPPDRAMALGTRWLFMNRWTRSGRPGQLTTNNFNNNWLKVCHREEGFDVRMVRVTV